MNAPLADDSGDEKRLFRAEGSAGRKQKRKFTKESRKKGGANFTNSKRFKPWSTAGAGEHAQSSSSAVLAGLLSQQLLQSGPSYARGLNVPQGSASAALHSQLGPCFECGKVGHYKKSCPLLRASYPAVNPR